MRALVSLGELVKARRVLLSLNQEELAAKCVNDINRSVVAHLEQGLRVPKEQQLKAICDFLGVPDQYWAQFTDKDSLRRLAFEEELSELVGYAVDTSGHERQIRDCIEPKLSALFSSEPGKLDTLMARDLFNTIMVFYGVEQASSEFFELYLGSNAFVSMEAFHAKVESYQKDAIRLFSTLSEAYRSMNSRSLAEIRRPLQPIDQTKYSTRSEWSAIEQIPDDRLPDLGYISAATVRQESAERKALQGFLRDLAKEIKKNGPSALDKIHEKKKRRMDSLLRKFDSRFKHGLLSPLFAPDPDELIRESDRLAPKSEEELARMQQTQEQALRNLGQYLSADYLDVYVATSMRTDADFVSVNQFVKGLFSHLKITPFRLRYFNPTQSWIDDRIAKGLVEALMLRRASMSIYMAQKTDTFGKDSEASVTLGQGKPVIVYVPKLALPDGSFDTETLARRSRDDLVGLLDDDEKKDVDDAMDEQAIMSKILNSKLGKLSDEDLIETVRRHWSDFDLYSETERIKGDEQKAQYRRWLDVTIYGGETDVKSLQALRPDLIKILVANTIAFEKRAKLFREIHPLALQVILSSGVLNGILVVRSIEQCAVALEAILMNVLALDVIKDAQNYRLVEHSTGSTIRVISRHRLLRNAFEAFYRVLG